MRGLVQAGPKPRKLKHALRKHILRRRTVVVAHGLRPAGDTTNRIHFKFEQRLHAADCRRNQPAPDFHPLERPIAKGNQKLSDFAGKRNVVLIFYPLDFSPICTNEHACFVNDLKQFEKLDAQVLGLSVDSAWAHKAFAEKMGITYPLLADFHPRGAVADKFGVYLPEKGITGRAIAIINKAGKIAWFKNYDIPVVPDMKEVSQALAAVK